MLSFSEASVPGGLRHEEFWRLRKVRQGQTFPEVLCFCENRGQHCRPSTEGAEKKGQRRKTRVVCCQNSSTGKVGMGGTERREGRRKRRREERRKGLREKGRKE